jgi:hypothetical protein
MPIKTILKDAFSGFGPLGWLLIFAKPLNSGVTILGDFDLLKNYGGALGRFLDTGWGTLTSIVLGALIVGYAIYKRLTRQDELATRFGKKQI